MSDAGLGCVSFLQAQLAPCAYLCHCICKKLLYTFMLFVCLPSEITKSSRKTNLRSYACGEPGLHAVPPGVQAEGSALQSQTSNCWSFLICKMKCGPLPSLGFLPDLGFKILFSSQ